MTEYLRKKDEPRGKDGKFYIYARTAVLALLAGFIPCDKDGNAVGAAEEVLGMGLSRRPDPEKIAALAEVESLKAEIAALKLSLAAPAVPAALVATEGTEPAKTPAPVIGTDPLAGMGRMEKVNYAKEKFGAKADHLKGNMKEADIDNEIERLQAESDLPGADDTK